MSVEVRGESARPASHSSVIAATIIIRFIGVEGYWLSVFLGGEGLEAEEFGFAAYLAALVVEAGAVVDVEVLVVGADDLGLLAAGGGAC